MEAVEAGGVPLFDARGDAFELLRRASVGIGIWRISTRSDLDQLAPSSLLVLAVYAGDDLEPTLLQRHPTVVVGVGLGEQ